MSDAKIQKLVDKHPQMTQEDHDRQAANYVWGQMNTSAPGSATWDSVNELVEKCRKNKN